MSEAESTPTKQNTHQNKNVLEKIIKLDKKNSLISVFDHTRNQKLTIRNNSAKTNMPWASNQNEQNMRNFWRHINQYYFKKIDGHDLERIDYLINLSNYPFKDSDCRYTDPNAYWTFKELISPEYKNLHKDSGLNKQNLRNLQKQYRMSTLMSPLTHDVPNVKTAKQHQKVVDSKYGFAVPKSKNLSSVLNEENKHVENMLKTYDDNTKNDDIGAELDSLMLQYKPLNEKISKKLKELKKSAIGENPSYIMSYDKPGEVITNSSSNAHENSLITKKQHLQATELIETQLKYLKELVILLENRQAAESIRCVLDYKKDSSTGKATFLVSFDEAISQKEIWIEEKVLDELDRLREQSLFKISNITQKTSRSLTTGNIISFHYINEKVKNKSMVIKEKPWKDLMKKRINDKFEGFNKEAAQTKFKDYSLCHHCKNVFPVENMIKCNYRSSVMGLPSLNPAFLDPFSHNQNNNRPPKRTVFSNKRSVYSFYNRKNGELFCSRKLCRVCLKQNYDQILSDIKNKQDWVCPFCQGLCYCSRCLRNDHLNKIANVFLLMGGDVADIKAESYLEQFIYSQMTEYTEPPINTLKTISKYALKPTPGRKKDDSLIKSKIKNYKNNSKEYLRMKLLRVQMEKVRMICSQVLRREKTKTKLELMNQEIFRMDLEKLTEGKIPLGLLEDDPSDFPVSPNPTPKKRGRKPKSMRENMSSVSPSRFERLDRTFGLFKGVSLPLEEDILLKMEDANFNSSELPSNSSDGPEVPKLKRGKKSSDSNQMEIEMAVSKASKNSKKKIYIKKTNKKQAPGAQLILNEEGSEAQIKKKRGRPALTTKQLTKNPSTPQKHQSLTPKKKSNASQNDLNDSGKKKRGRPRKDTIEDEAPEIILTPTRAPKSRRSSSQSRDNSTKKRAKTPTPVKKLKKETPQKVLALVEEEPRVTPKKSNAAHSQGNPNEPNDTYSPKVPRLKKELQKIWQNQNPEQFSIFSATNLNIKTTRNSLAPLLKRKRSNSGKR